MFAKIRLLNGFQEPLWYTVPETLASRCLVGSLVAAPLQGRTVTGVVDGLSHAAPNVPFKLKPIIDLEPFPIDIQYIRFMKQLAYYYQLDYMLLIKRVRSFIQQRDVKTRVPHSNDRAGHGHKVVSLTAEQQVVCDFLTPEITQKKYAPTLLHGVTGSGKTEVYKRLIEHTIAQGDSVMLLLPEVSLAVQFARLLRAQLPKEIKLYSFHSASGSAEKRALWRSLVRGEPVLILGVHLPVLLPIANLGLIIVDEEHEVGYQEKKHPKINSKEAAIWRAHMNNIPILLGSATPSLSSLDNVKTKGWHFFELKKRFAGIFPTVKTVSLKDAKNRRNFWVTTELERAIKARLERGEQTIIFLNRRGYSFFVQCKACSFIFMCNNCSVSLTLHEDGRLSCHYCALRQELLPECPGCKASAKNYLKKGVGTQQVVSILETLFPSARIARADMDTTVNKKQWQATLEQFEHGVIDILVGTQTITKGYHFPNVTLVGILWADLNLHFPMYNAAETCLQQLIQVAGRAGRTGKPSQVIVQTMVEHSIFNYLNEIDYVKFYGSQMEKRQESGYPPAMRLAEIELKFTDEGIIEQEAQQLAKELRAVCGEVLVLGPARPPVHKVKHIHMRKIYLKCSSVYPMMALFGKIKRKSYQSAIYFTPNPLS
ncbi:MAG: primosomal protein N' [Candidatus Babeliales bacterium]